MHHFLGNDVQHPNPLSVSVMIEPLKVLFLLSKCREFGQTACSEQIQDTAEALSANEFAPCADLESDHFGSHSLDFEFGVSVGQSRVSFVAEARVELISILSFAVQIYNTIGAGARFSGGAGVRFANGQFLVSFARVAEDGVGCLYGGRDRSKVKLSGGTEPVAHKSVAIASAPLFCAVFPSAVASSEFLPRIDDAARYTWTKTNGPASSSASPCVKRLRNASES